MSSKSDDEDTSPFQFSDFLNINSDDDFEPITQAGSDSSEVEIVSQADTNSSEIDPEGPNSRHRAHHSFSEASDLLDYPGITQCFVNYFNDTYKVVYSECCNDDATTPWEGLSTVDEEDMDELFSRFTHFLIYMLNRFWNEESHSFSRLTSGMFEDWFDLCFQRAECELVKAGQDPDPLIRNDVWEERQCFYMRLADWVQEQILEHDLEASIRSEFGSIHSIDSGYQGEDE